MNSGYDILRPPEFVFMSRFVCFAHEYLLLDVVCMCDGEDEPGKGRLQMQNDGKMDDTLLHFSFSCRRSGK